MATPIIYLNGIPTMQKIGPSNLIFYLFPLYLQIPISLGIGCAFYWSIWLVLRLVSALVRILVKRRAVAQSE